LVAILFGSSLGFLNGLMVSKGKMPPFIATLGMMGIARSLARLFNNGSPIWAIPQPFLKFWEEKVVSIPILIIIYIIIFLLTFIIIGRTYYGRCIYAVGANEKASLLSGINSDKIKLLVYTVSGFFCSIGALMFIGRSKFASPDSGILYHLDAITAVVIGGTSFSGGKGTAIGTFIGVLIVGILTNLMNILNINAFWQQTIKGIVLLSAIYLNEYYKNR
jgi:ribose transport system permease protein